MSRKMPIPQRFDPAQRREQERFLYPPSSFDSRARDNSESAGYIVGSLHYVDGNAAAENGGFAPEERERGQLTYSQSGSSYGSFGSDGVISTGASYHQLTDEEKERVQRDLTSTPHQIEKDKLGTKVVMRSEYFARSFARWSVRLMTLIPALYTSILLANETWLTEQKENLHKSGITPLHFPFLLLGASFTLSLGQLALCTKRFTDYGNKINNTVAIWGNYLLLNYTDCITFLTFAVTIQAVNGHLQQKNYHQTFVDWTTNNPLFCFLGQIYIARMLAWCLQHSLYNTQFYKYNLKPFLGRIVTCFNYLCCQLIEREFTPEDTDSEHLDIMRHLFEDARKQGEKSKIAIDIKTPQEYFLRTFTSWSIRLLTLLPALYASVRIAHRQWSNDAAQFLEKNHVKPFYSPFIMLGGAFTIALMQMIACTKACKDWGKKLEGNLIVWHIRLSIVEAACLLISAISLQTANAYYQETSPVAQTVANYTTRNPLYCFVGQVIVAKILAKGATSFFSLFAQKPKEIPNTEAAILAAEDVHNKNSPKGAR